MSWTSGRMGSHCRPAPRTSLSHRRLARATVASTGYRHNEESSEDWEGRARSKPTPATYTPMRLVLSCLIHAVAGRTFPAGERGSAAGSLLSSHYPNYTWACVLCRPSPEFPFRFIWVLGWSTWHLALDPSSVLYLQHKLCSYLDALQHLPPPQPVPRQLLPLRYIQLTQPRLYTPRLLAFHCFLCDHRSCVQRELVGLVVAVATRQAVPCRFVVWRSKARSSVLCWEQPLPFGAPARPAPRLHCHWRRGLWWRRCHRQWASLPLW